MKQETREIMAVVVIIVLCIIVIVNGAVKYNVGFADGVGSVETRTPRFEMTIVGGYVNESVYNYTYYHIYDFADYYPPPAIYNDSFILAISIFGYYDNITQRESAPFGVKFSDELIDHTNVTIEMVCFDSEREEGSVGLYFNPQNVTAVTAFAYGHMQIVMFGHGSVPAYSTIFGASMLTIQEWEVEG